MPVALFEIDTADREERGSHSFHWSLSLNSDRYCLEVVERY